MQFPAPTRPLPLLLSPPPQVRPLEEQFKFGHFFSPLLNESDFEAKPSVLLLGQYSTGEGRGGAGGREEQGEKGRGGAGKGAVQAFSRRPSSFGTRLKYGCPNTAISAPI